MMYGADNNEFRIFNAHLIIVQFVSLPFRQRKNLNMAATPLISVAKRLLANVDADHADYSETIVNVAVRNYRDTDRFEREVENIFHRSPLLVALSCDLREHGDFASLVIAGRPILVVRGKDGVARAFLNICRHRGAPVTEECFGHSRRFTCPYHSWVYDTEGALVGNTDRAAFEGIDVDSLVELPTAEKSGAVFAILTPGLALDIDGYHLGYLHGKSIGTKSITNRNTYDLYGPHVRLGFANKPLPAMRDLPEDEWQLLNAMSLVHYIFPNISISGQPNGGLMMSRILPGSTPDRCQVEQFQYFREPMTTPEQIADADYKRELYLAVTRDEDFSTVMKITDAMAAIPDDAMRYGRNESGNQNLHRWAAALADGTTP